MGTVEPMRGWTMARRILDSLRSRLGERGFLYALSLACGVASAVAAIALKTSLHFIEGLARGVSGSLGIPWLLAIFPLLGIGLTLAWTKLILKRDIGHGISRILESVSRGGARMEPHNCYSSVVANALTTGMGGSVGMEAPILATGAALGANIGQAAGMEYRDRVLLIGCGIAGAMGGIFRAPLTGLVFCLEVLSLDAAASALVPLILSGMTAYLLSAAISRGAVEFSFTAHSDFHMGNLPWYLALGILCALLSILFMRALRGVEALAGRLSSPLARWLLGAAALGLLILAFPAFFGDGHAGIKALLSGKAMEIAPPWLERLPSWMEGPWLFPAFLFLLAFLKPLATALTTASGGVGGVFAPALLGGAALGSAFSLGLGALGLDRLNQGNFALAGMAGIVSGIMHAPLTGVFLIAEISASYHLLPALALVAAVSYSIVRIFEPWSVYTAPLARAGRLLTHNKDAAALTLMNMEDCLEPYPEPLRPETTVAEMERRVAFTGEESFPIGDGEGGCLGFVRQASIKPLLGDPEIQRAVIMADLMEPVDDPILAGDSMEKVMRVFTESGRDELAVFEGRRLRGRLRRGKVFDAYREMLVKLQGGSFP